MEEYLRAVHDYSVEENIEFPTIRESDFFPYQQELIKTSVPWPGFYSTNPFLKRKIKQLAEYERSYSQLAALMAFNLNSTQYAHLLNQTNQMKQTVSVLHHHDGITGTSPKKTASDYQI